MTISLRHAHDVAGRFRRAGPAILLVHTLDWLKHAFAIDPPGPLDPTPADREMVERLCAEVVRRRLTAPALMLLEMSRPLNYVSAQFLHFAHPFIAALGQGARSDQLARFLEQRGSLEYLTDRLEQLETERRAAKRGAATQDSSEPPA